MGARPQRPPIGWATNEKYTASSIGGLQSEQATRIRGRLPAQRRGVDAAERGDARDSERDPCGLVTLATMRNRRQVRSVGFDEDAIIRNRTHQIIARPVPERHDSAERHVPSSLDGSARECDAAGKAVQHTADASRRGLANEYGGIVIRVPGMDDYRAIVSRGEFELHGEGTTLEIARRVVIVVVEATFTNRDRAGVEHALQRGNVRRGIKRLGVVRVNPGCKSDEARMRFRNPGRVTCLLDRRTDADDACSARIASAADYRVAVTVEGFVRKVGVAVDEVFAEVFHAVDMLLRGYFASIQRSIGPAI